MFKHPTITRPSRNQLHQLKQQEARSEWLPFDQNNNNNNNCILEEDAALEMATRGILSSPQTVKQAHLNQELQFHPSPLDPPHSPAGSCASYSSSRLPASFMSSIRRVKPAVSSLPATPIKSTRSKTTKESLIDNQTNQLTSNKNHSESMIKVFAQTLSQDVEYITLHVDAQTKSQQIIKSLLRKFRLKHRDPNLFYLTLERFIRKDGLKCKTTMLLSDESCPMQYQQCCSNPPYNDIRFTLQTRAGALVKIHCSDVVPETRYKCLSLSTQTTVEETIELMLHCLNLAPLNPSSNNLTETNSCTHHHNHQHNCSTQTQHPRQSGSPSSTGSSNDSSCSSSSSSSGIDSDLPATNRGLLHKHQASLPVQMSNSSLQGQLNQNSRTSSTTSISSASNASNISSSTIDRYCLLIECQDSTYKRILEPDEYLVDVYQSLLSEAKEVQRNEVYPSSQSGMFEQADQWFFIKMKRRNQISQANSNQQHQQNNNTNLLLQPSPISLSALARQATPLPPIPPSIKPSPIQFQRFVSTTQIEVNKRPAVPPPPVPSRKPEMCKPIVLSNPTGLDLTDSLSSRCPPPPALILLPPVVRPRRRNLSNASSTFLGPPNIGVPSPMASLNRRRRYDPAQLEADLSRLDMNNELDIDQESSKITTNTQQAESLVTQPTESAVLVEGGGSGGCEQLVEGSLQQASELIVRTQQTIANYQPADDDVNVAIDDDDDDDKLNEPNREQ